MLAFGKELRTVKNRYLIKHRGDWKIITTWALTPDWDDVSDVIWLQNPKTMIESWWLMKNNRRCTQQLPVTDEELTWLLLQVDDI